MSKESTPRTAREKALSGKARSREAGMTLVETMIAAGVTAMGLVLTMGSFVSISTASDVSEEQAVAATMVSSVVEELRSMTYDELLAYQPPTTVDLGAGTAVSVACFDWDGGAHQLPVSPAALASPLPNPMEFQVTVVWWDRMGRPYSMRTTAFHGR
jgi:type II secretory pathway pseudopilin PulG